MSPTSYSTDYRLRFVQENFSRPTKPNSQQDTTAQPDAILAFDEPRSLKLSIHEERKEESKDAKPPSSGFIRV